MGLARGAAACVALCALLPAACAAPKPAPVATAPRPADVVVLLAAPDGSVGRVTVSNAAGRRTLDTAGSATRVADGRTAPTEPEALSAAQIDALFGAALAAQPEPPLHFTLYFEQGSTDLTADSRRLLPRIAAAIRDRRSVDTSVVGHADTSGDARANLELSLARAAAVGALLVAEGVPEDTLDITSHGEANPLVPTGDDVPEPRNRRVEVTAR